MKGKNRIALGIGAAVVLAAGFAALNALQNRNPAAADKTATTVCEDAGGGRIGCRTVATGGGAPGSVTTECSKAGAGKITCRTK